MAGPTNVEEMDILDVRLDRIGVLELGLFTTAPADDCSGGVEVSTTSTAYVRIPINSASTDFQPAVSGAPSTKSGPKTGSVWAWPTAPTAAWGTCVAGVVFEIMTTRNDTSSVTHSNTTVDDTNAIAADLGRQVSGTGIPVNTYITAVNVGVGYTISNAATSSATITLSLLHKMRQVATLTTPTTIGGTDPAPQFDATHQLVFQAGDPADTF